MHRFAFRVRYGDTDQMGFAYYGNYLRWFEVGRAEMLRALGRSYREIEREGVWLPVLAAHCRYLKPAHYDEVLVVETAVLALGRAQVRFGYRIVLEETAEKLAYGWTEHCFMGPDGRPRRPPPGLAALLEGAPRLNERELA